ncbi:hypothetical protein NDU88_002511 [Pleurodeles waltl]|uniref:Uncharacterized protein n=1 Tax=Pleurodeles waltl TaxID=8319 RepID=A0AAV7RA67_PLEWA|nr:hypothetical protein NDU88_002511 [Pleurodeles waltl]
MAKPAPEARRRTTPHAGRECSIGNNRLKEPSVNASKENTQHKAQPRSKIRLAVESKLDSCHVLPWLRFLNPDPLRSLCNAGRLVLSYASMFNYHHSCYSVLCGSLNESKYLSTGESSFLFASASSASFK